MSRVAALLPDDFPDTVSAPIMEGLGRQLKRLEKDINQ